MSYCWLSMQILYGRFYIEVMIWKANAKFASKILKWICRPNEIEFDKIRHIMKILSLYDYLDLLFVSCPPHGFTNSRIQDLTTKNMSAH